MLSYPDPLRLAGKELPQVTTADHLGHILSQQCSMDPDCIRARQKFISTTSDIREQLHFAHPQQVIKAIQIMAMDSYGSMLWTLKNESCQKFFRCWNTCIKLVYNVPRSTYTYLVEGFLASEFHSLRNQVLSRYATFYRKLLNSPSLEIRALARIVQEDPRSPTYCYIKYLTSLTGLTSPLQYSSARIRMLLPLKNVPDNEN